MNFNPFEGFSEILLEVFWALLPLLVLFLMMQILFLRLPMRRMFNLAKGALLAYIGLSLFLQGVHVGFFPVGDKIGSVLAERPDNWILIPLGFVLGFVATFAEPAVRILILEVNKVSGGAIPRRMLLFTLSFGVALSIALSMLRILTGWPLMVFLVPGYLLALLFLFLTPPTFVHIAFDAGGVATGPMTVTFIMAIAVGAAGVVEGRDPILDGFGMISLVALAPIICVLIVGLIFHRRESVRDD